MGSPESWVVVGLDNGGTNNNATVLDAEDVPTAVEVRWRSLC